MGKTSRRTGIPQDESGNHDRKPYSFLFQTVNKDKVQRFKKSIGVLHSRHRGREVWDAIMLSVLCEVRPCFIQAWRGTERSRKGA